MLHDGPRPVPPYDRSRIRQSFWYCLICCADRPDAGAIANHVEMLHFISNAEAGVHYAYGSQLLLMQSRWDEWGKRQAEKAALALASMRGVEDFLTDCGDA